MRPGSARPGSARVARPGSARVKPNTIAVDGGTAVRVAVRIRPLNSSDGANPVVAVDRSPADARSVVLDEKSRDGRQFNFDNVFTAANQQQEVFSTIGVPMLEEAYKGFNVCLFAYGQTGSGKTYSVIGDEGSGSLEDEGIVPRFIREMFLQAQSKVEEDNELTVKVSMALIEIYMEKVRDLLVAVPKGTERESLELVEDQNRRVYVKGLSVHPVLGSDRALQLLRIGTLCRQQAETKMNEFSSRSHSIIQFTISQVFDNSPERRDVESVVWLVDLAGSERQSKAEASGVQFEEAKRINHSLLMLGRALNSFSEGRNEFLSLRESKLTRLLSECFGGNTKTWMLATVSPASYNISETISTLEYASNAKKITNRAVVNRKAKQLELKELKQVAARLEENLDGERSIVQALQRRHTELTHEVAELRLLAARPLAVKEGPSNDFLASQLELQRQENAILREKIESMNAKLRPVRRVSEKTGVSSFFIGRCGLTLTDVVSSREKSPWKLRAIDSVRNVEAVLFVEAYPIDSSTSLGVPSSLPAPTSLTALLHVPLLLYVKVIGAAQLPAEFSDASFCRIGVADDRCCTPRQTDTQRNSTTPTWNTETIVVFPPVTESVITRFGDSHLFTFEVFGMKQSALGVQL